MSIFTNIAVSLSTILISLCLVFISLAAVLLGIRLVKALDGRWQLSDFEADKKLVGDYLRTLDIEIAYQIHSRSEMLKRYICNLAETVDGDMDQNLLDLYSELGFVAIDLRRLESKLYYRRVDALTCLRAFQYPLGDDQWDRLLTETRWEFRWATMEYLVSIKGKNALSRLVAFLSARNNIYQGNLHHLLAHFASIDGDAIAYLLSHADDERLQEALLKTLSIYPVPGSEEIIRSSFNYMANKAVIISGLEALDAHPDKANLKFLEQFAIHEDQRVRTALAKNLRHYPGGVGMLDSLAIDGSFEVRAQVASALEELLPYSGTVVSEILATPAHPCHEPLKVHGITVPRDAA